MLVLPNRNQWTVAIFFLLLFSFLLLRAWQVPLLPDEAFTYFLYAEPATFFAPDAQEDANNHLLNSILSSISLKLFGHNTLVMRIPSLLFALLYMHASYLLAKRQPNLVLFWLTLLGFNLIYPIVEFHALARGYGMSFSLLLYAIHLLMRLQSEQKIGLAWLILGISILGLFAQLSLLFAFGGVLILTSVIWSNRSNLTLLKKFIFPVLTFFVLLGFVRYIHHMKNAGLLYFGTHEDFPISSFTSLNGLLFEQEAVSAAWLHLLVFFVPIVALFYAFVKHRVEAFYKPSFVFPFVLCSAVFGTLLSVFFLNGSGPLSRTALYFFLLLVGALLFLDFGNRLKVIVSTGLLAFVFISFSKADVNKVNFWKEYAVQREVYNVLATEMERFEVVAGSMYLDRIFAAEHNRFRQSMSKNYHVMKSGFAELDYLLLTPDDRKQHAKHLSAYDTVFFSEMGVSLFKKRQNSSVKFLIAKEFSFQNDTLEYLNLGSLYQATDFSSEHLVLDVQMSLQLPNPLQSISWVVSFFDADGFPIESRYYRMNEFSKDWKTGVPFDFVLTIPQIPVDCHEVRLYIYNPQRQLHNQAKITYSVYSYSI